MISHLEKLVNWRPVSVDNTKVYSLFGTADIQSSFMCKHIYAWLMEYLEEIIRFLDTLILLVYHERCTMSATQFHRILSILFLNDFTHVITTLGSLESSLTTAEIIITKQFCDEINFKFILFICTCLQLWRDYSPITNANHTTTTIGEGKTMPSHHLVESITFDVMNRINGLFNKFCGSFGADIQYLNQTKLINVNSIEITAFLWKVFLNSNNLETIHKPSGFGGNNSSGTVLMNVSSKKIFASDDIAIREYDMVSTMLTLTTACLSAPLRSANTNSNDNCNNGNQFVFCSILQEIVNILIKHRTMTIDSNDDEDKSSTTSSSLLDIEEMIVLIRYAYPNHYSEYFNEFLLAWKDEDYRQSYPLIRLLYLLSEETMHCPTYFFSLMSILCSVPMIQEEVSILLDKVFNVISVEKLSDLQFAIQEPIDETTTIEDIENESLLIHGNNGNRYHRVRWLTVTEWRNEFGNHFLMGTEGRVVYNEQSDGDNGFDNSDDIAANSRHWLPRLTICSPSDGHQGFLMDVNEKEETCTVKWQSLSCDWWSVLMDYLISMKIDPFDPYHHHNNQQKTVGGHGHGAGSAKGIQLGVEQSTALVSVTDNKNNKQDNSMIDLIQSAFELQSAMLTSSIRYKTHYQYRWNNQYNRLIMLKIFKQADCLQYYSPLIQLQQQLKEVEEEEQEEQQTQSSEYNNITMGLHIMNYLFENSQEYGNQLIQQLQALDASDDEIERIIQEINNVYQYDIMTSKTLSLTYTEFLAKHLIHLLTSDINKVELAMHLKTKALNVVDKTTAQNEQIQALSSLLSNMMIINRLLQDDFELSYHFIVKLMKTFSFSSNTTQTTNDFSFPSIASSSGADESIPPRFEFWYKVNQLASACGSIEGFSGGNSAGSSGYALKAALYSLCSTLFANLNHWSQTSHLTFLQRYHSRVHVHLASIHDSVLGSSASPTSSIIGNSHEDIYRIQQDMNIFLSTIVRYTGEELLILNVVDNNATSNLNSSLLVTTENSADYLNSMKALFQLVQVILTQCQQNYGEVNSIGRNATHVSVGPGSVGLLSSLDYLITHTQCLELFYQYATLLTSWIIINQAVDGPSSDDGSVSMGDGHSTLKDLLSSRADLPDATEGVVKKSSVLPIDYYSELIATKTWPFLEQLLPIVLDVMSLALQVIHILSSWSMTKDRLIKPLLSVVAMPMRTLSPLTTLLQQQQPLFAQSGVYSLRMKPGIGSIAAVEHLTYFVALTSMLGFDLKIYQLKNVKQLRRWVMVVLNDLVPAFYSPAKSSSPIPSPSNSSAVTNAGSTAANSSASLIDTIGNVNLITTGTTLVQALESNVENLPEQALLWQLLSSFARFHPDILSIWFSNSAATNASGTTTSTNLQRTNSISAVGKCQLANLLLASLRKSATEVFSSVADAEVMTHLLSFCHQLFHYGKYYPLIAKVALYIAADEQFWKSVSSPLKEDTPRPPLEDLIALADEMKVADMMQNLTEEDEGGVTTLTHDSIVRVALQDGASETMTNILTGIVPNIYDSSNSLAFKKTAEFLKSYQQKCKLITLVITLLSFERYGYFYDLDRMVLGIPQQVDDATTIRYCEQAKKITQRVDAMYASDLKVPYRFLGWIRHYLHVHEESSMFRREYLEELSMRCQYFGFDFVQLCGTVHDGEMSNSSGISSVLKQSMAGMISLSLRSDIEMDSEIQQYLLAIRSLLNSLVLFQCHASITAMDLTLLRHWREFLQLFVVPNVPISPEGTAVTHDVPSSAGSLSPVVSSQASSSPISSKDSSFTGDKRSYEIVCEILKTITAPLCSNSGALTIVADSASFQTLQSCNPIRLLLEMHEKSGLLMTMLHHQIKHIAFRASDPEKSVVQGRDVLGAIRLSPDKLNTILNQLIDLYVTMFATPFPQQAVANAIAASGGSPTTTFLADVISSSFVANTTSSSGASSESSLWMSLLLASHVPQGNTSDVINEEVVVVTKLRMKIQHRLLSTILLILTTLNAQPAVSATSAVASSSDTALNRGENSMKLFQAVSDLLHGIAYHGGLSLIFKQSKESKDQPSSVDSSYFDFSVQDLMVLTKIALQVVLQVSPTPSLIPTSSSSPVIGASAWLSLWEQTRFPGFMLEFVYFLQQEATKLVVEVEPGLMINPTSSSPSNTSSSGNHEFDKIFESIQQDFTRLNGNGSSGKINKETGVKDVSSLLTSSGSAASTSKELTAMLTMSYEILIKLVDGYSPWTHSAVQQEQQQQFYLTVIRVIRENAAFEKMLSLVRSVVTFATSNVMKTLGNGIASSSSAKAASFARSDLFALYLLEKHHDFLTTWQRALDVLDHIFSKVILKVTASGSASSGSPSTSVMMPTVAQRLFDFFAYYEPIFLYPLVGTSLGKREQREQQQQQWMTLSQLKLVSSTYQYLLALSHFSPSQKAFDDVLMTAATSSASATVVVKHLLKTSSQEDNSLSLSALTYELTSWLSLVYAGSNSDLMKQLIIFSAQDAKLQRSSPSNSAVKESKVASTGEDKEKKRVGFGQNQTFAFSAESVYEEESTEERASSFLSTPIRGGEQSSSRAPRSILKSTRAKIDSGDFTISSANGGVASSPYMRTVSAAFTKALTVLIKTISLLMPSPFDTESGEPVIERGRTVFYVSEKTGYLCEGVITAVEKSGKTFDVLIQGMSISCYVNSLHLTFWNLVLGVANNGHIVVMPKATSPVTVIAAAGAGPHQLPSLLSSYTPSNVVNLTECEIRTKQIRFVNRPKVYFSRIATPSVVPAGAPATGAGVDVVLSTGHLLAALDKMDSLLEGAPSAVASSQGFLFQQTMYIAIYAIDHISLAPIVQEIPVILEQIEVLQELIMSYCERLKKIAGQRGPSSKDLTYCQYLLRWSEEIAYRLQRFLGVDVQPHVQTPIVAGERVTKKRLVIPHVVYFYLIVFHFTSPKLKDKKRFDYSDEDCI